MVQGLTHRFDWKDQLSPVAFTLQSLEFSLWGSIAVYILIPPESMNAMTSPSPFWGCTAQDYRKGRNSHLKLTIAASSTQLHTTPHLLSSYSL